jgi:hypothetical protein
VGFVDDVNLIAWGRSTEGNCRNLALLHERCLRWAQCYGVCFEPSKYDLIHLTRHPRKFDITQGIQLGDVYREPSL